MTAARHDIATPEDIDRLVATFYGKLLKDPIVGFFFNDIARIDLPEHLPKISAFWQQQLLGRPGYRGQTFAVHSALQKKVTLKGGHFHRWLFLFDQTIDELFAGPGADGAKVRARNIARSMQQALTERHPTELEPGAGVQYQSPGAGDQYKSPGAGDQSPGD
jgi:hemoglobin